MDPGKRLDKLVRQCQKGDSQAWGVIFTEFQPRLRYYLRRLDGNTLEIDDVLQDVWAKALDKIDSLRMPRAFVAWLYRIARNEIYSRARGQAQVTELSDEHLATIPNEPEPTFDTETGEQIHQALVRLKPHHREVLTLNFLEDLSHREIAEILDLHPGTVKSRIYHAKQSLRRLLENSHG